MQERYSSPFHIRAFVFTKGPFTPDACVNTNSNPLDHLHQVHFKCLIYLCKLPGNKLSLKLCAAYGMHASGLKAESSMLIHAPVACKCSASILCRLKGMEWHEFWQNLETCDTTSHSQIHLRNILKTWNTDNMADSIIHFCQMPKWSSEHSCLDSSCFNVCCTKY